MDYVFVPVKKKGAGDSKHSFLINRVENGAPTAAITGESEEQRMSWLLSLTPKDRVFLAGGGYGISSLLAGATAAKTKKELPEIWMCSTRHLKALRDEKGSAPTEEETAARLAFLSGEPGSFVQVPHTELDIAELCAAVRALLAIEKVRVASGNRLQSNTTKLQLFSNSERMGKRMHELNAMAKDAQSALVAWEGMASKSIKQIVDASPYLTELFSLFVRRGISYYIAARFVADVVNIRRFPRFAGIKHYLGVYPDKGKLKHRRSGEMGDYKVRAQSLFYLIGEQMIKQDKNADGTPGEFRQAYDAYKTRVVPEHHKFCSQANCKKKPGLATIHINKNARWHVAGKVLFQWWKSWRDFAAEMDAQAA